MTSMRYTISVQDAGFEGEWCELAAFHWFVDAKSYALQVSQRDGLSRFVRLDREGHEPTYFRDGRAADHLFEEAA